MMFMPMFSPTVGGAPTVLMTAGELGGWQGYDNAAYIDDVVFGAISGQPMPGGTLLSLVSSSGVSVIFFQEDVTVDIHTKSLFIDDVEYPISSASGVDFYSGWGTEIYWSPPAFSFLGAHSYAIRIE